MRNTKPTLGLIAAAAVILTGCSSSSSKPGASSSDSSQATGASSAAGGSKTVAFVPGFLGNGFYNSVYAGVQAQAKKYGWKTTQQGSGAAFSASAQTPYVNAVCSRKPDVLVIAPTDQVAMRTPIQNCMKLGVKVVVVDTTLTNAAGVISSIGANNEDGGQRAGEFIGQALGGKGTVSMHTGSPQANTQAARVAGAKKVLSSKYPGIKQLQVIQDASTNAAQTSATSSLVGHPDLSAIFDATGACVGEQEAIDKWKGSHKPILVCYDSSPAQDKLLKAGKIAAMVVQPAFQEGTLAVEDAWDTMNGKSSSVQAHVILDTVIIPANKANDPAYQKYFYKG